MTANIGQELAQARQERGLTLEQIARETHIRLHYLEALEAGEFHKLPSQVQAKGFLRTYAAYLDLAPERFLSVFEKKPVASKPPLQEQSDQAVKNSKSHSDQEKAVFEKIGNDVKSQRELLGLSIEDVARHTHLRDHYLRALEAGDLNGLPSPVQGRGMLQNYASFLGLDSEQLLLMFAEGLQIRQSLHQTTPTRKKVSKRAGATQSKILRFFSIDMLVGLLLVTFLVGFVVWGIIQINSLNTSPEALPTVPSIAESFFNTSDVSISPDNDDSDQMVTEAESPDTPLPAPVNNNEVDEDQIDSDEDDPIVAESDGTVMVHLVIRQRAWLRVTVDGEVEYEGRVSPGSAYTFIGDQLVRINTGNGAAIEVHFNQRPLGPVGIYGEVVERVFSADGMWTATPSITPTLTQTPVSTPTPLVEETIEPPAPMP